ncbi:zinc-dependent metalloprotease [Rhabdothermincola sediminis]|uniref:zinc-dependent metalloprotease n=1 Tax=Rhabdothermincola sediminis TaxID=2751370 RepID=UPI001AA09729|nr:zinc-dependent metalloprotease [Rhabdothermincola sediminis]
MSGTVDWALAERVAVRAAGREPFAESYHYASLEPDFTEFTARAEDLVEQATGLRSLNGDARGRVTDRAGWVRANIASFQRLLRPLIQRFGERMAASPFAPITRAVAGAEVGVMLGWMSNRVLGQYDLLIIEEESPHDQDLVYYVGPNVLALEKMYAFPPREFRLWIALHEVTHRAQFTGIPWMREHFLGLVEQMLESVDPDPKRFLAAIDRAVAAVRRGENPLSDGGVVALVASPEQRAVLDQLSGLMSLLEGHGDITMDRAGADLVPSAGRFSSVLRKRRQSAQGLARLLQQLVGLEAKLAQYEQGERFIEEVERAGGPSLLELAWERSENLPSIAEIREPATWIARVAPARVA